MGMGVEILHQKYGFVVKCIFQQALLPPVLKKHQACKGRYNTQIRSGPEQFVVHAAGVLAVTESATILAFDVLSARMLSKVSDSA